MASYLVGEAEQLGSFGDGFSESLLGVSLVVCLANNQVLFGRIRA
jgi:hypothetical protein